MQRALLALKTTFHQNDWRFQNLGRGRFRSLFGDHTPATLAAALLEAAGGNQRLADTLHLTNKLQYEVKRLKAELKETLGAKFDPRVYPYLEAREKNTHVRQYTHNHATMVIEKLGTGERALWTTLLLSTVWGGYVEKGPAELMTASGLK